MTTSTDLWRIVGGDIRYMIHTHDENRFVRDNFLEGRIKGMCSVLVREAGDDRIGEDDSMIVYLWQQLAAVPYIGQLRLSETQARSLRSAVRRRIAAQKKRAVDESRLAERYHEIETGGV